MLKTIRPSTHAIQAWRIPQLSAARTVFARQCGPVHISSSRWGEESRRLFTSLPDRTEQHAEPVIPSTAGIEGSGKTSADRFPDLPITCPGCGAPAQTIDQEVAGYYGSKRAARVTQSRGSSQEDAVYKSMFSSLVLSGIAPTLPKAPEPTTTPTDTPLICDRCHYLRYQSRGTSIAHPSMHSIQQIIEESPHTHNHIYHVLDAADFPMSVIPSLQSALKLPRLRTRNRRSKSIQYIRGRMAEVSFIITRSDLLAPKKEQVDSLVPYLREVLREALGRTGRNIRLGNVRCVSAQRGWWTRTVKDDIWNRGGAGWMVGKVNVGKSALYEVVFPKGRTQVDADINRLRSEEKRALEADLQKLDRPDETSARIPAVTLNTKSSYTPFGTNKALNDTEASPGDPASYQETEISLQEDVAEETQDYFDGDEDGSLLPPARPETAFPDMPLVSSLPGTTASPIRIPFGNGKGELIDLPGIQRTSLDSHIKPEGHKALIMKSRIAPEQYTVKPGQSLLLGGTIRISPKADDLIVLAYPFVPMTPHVTSHEKAIAIQTGYDGEGNPYGGTVESIATDQAKANMKSAGVFQLRWDVTKRRAGPLTTKSAGRMKASELPFIVYSADILIESVGWVELTCQVRNRRRSFISNGSDDGLGETFPEVEVFTPEGKFIGVRPPMGAWLLGRPDFTPKYRRRGRPRQTISMKKRQAGGAAGQRKVLLPEE